MTHGADAIQGFADPRTEGGGPVLLERRAQAHRVGNIAFD
jgi:hypothetical protein